MHKVSLIPGHGIGPEISESVKKVFQSAEVPVEWETVSVEPVVGPDGKPTIPAETLASFQRTKVGLKGPLMTPVGKGYMSLNLLLRKTFSLYANVRPCRSIPNLERTPYSNVDTVLIRENTEGEYSGIEHELVPGQLTTSIKVITQKACQRILHFAFRHCLELGRPSVTVVHKAAIMRATDGLFLECARKTALDYPSLFLRELSLDDACFELVREPCQFNNTVMVMPNLYGDILSDLSAGLIGGLGLTPSGNIGDNGALFESVRKDGLLGLTVLIIIVIIIMIIIMRFCFVGPRYSARYCWQRFS